MHEIDLDLQNGPRSNIIMPIESHCVTFYFMTTVMFTLTINVYEKILAEICMTLTMTFRMGQGQM